MEGIPVTSVARTLADVAALGNRRHLERAVEAAEARGVLDVRDVDRLLIPGRRGVRALREAVHEHRRPLVTNSELERLFLLDCCRAAGLPMPATNVFVAGHVVDAVWHDHRLVVELDGHAFHGTRAAFERDRKRDADLQLAGDRVLRLTHRRLTRERAAVIETLRSLLAVSARRPAPA